MARDVVKDAYRDLLRSNLTIGNQLEEYAIVSKKVAGLLRGGKFLRNGLDKNVSIISLIWHILICF